MSKGGMLSARLSGALEQRLNALIDLEEKAALVKLGRKMTISRQVIIVEALELGLDKAEAQVALRNDAQQQPAVSLTSVPLTQQPTPQPVGPPSGPQRAPGQPPALSPAQRPVSQLGPPVRPTGPLPRLSKAAQAQIDGDDNES